MLAFQFSITVSTKKYCVSSTGEANEISRGCVTFSRFTQFLSSRGEFGELLLSLLFEAFSLPVPWLSDYFLRTYSLPRHVSTLPNGLCQEVPRFNEVISGSN